MFEVHSYLATDNINNCKATIDQMLRDINTYLAPKGPIIFGEWGTSEGDINYYEQYRGNTLEYANYFVKRAKEYGFCTLYWMGLTDGEDRTVPKFTQPDLVDKITKGYYGDNYNYDTKLKGDVNLDGLTDISDINLLINVMLGRQDASLLYGDPDVTGDGRVDVGDVNAVINAMLGRD